MSESLHEGESFGLVGPVALNARHWKAEAARATVILVHGYSEHSNRYQHVAAFFNARQIDVIALDLPGHGLSEGRRSDIKDFGDYIKSVEALVVEAQKRKCPAPFHLLGHSLGGLIAIRFIETSYLAPQIKSLSLSSPLLGLARFSPSVLPWLKMGISLLPNITINNSDELDESTLTHDREMTASRVADPLIKSVVTPHWLREALGARVKAFQEIGRIQLPVGLFQSGDEKVVSREEALRFINLFQGSKVIKVYEGFYHEILNELGRDRVLSDLASWMESQSA